MINPSRSFAISRNLEETIARSKTNFFQSGVETSGKIAQI
jgi:hypothetical protein